MCTLTLPFVSLPTFFLHVTWAGIQCPEKKPSQINCALYIFKKLICHFFKNLVLNTQSKSGVSYFVSWWMSQKVKPTVYSLYAVIFLVHVHQMQSVF